VTVLAEDIGIDVVGASFNCLVPKGTDLGDGDGHLLHIRVFSTAEDNQRAVHLALMAADVSSGQPPRPLGTLTLDGIRPAPRGRPRIELRLSVAASGQVEVAAKERPDGKVARLSCSPVAVSG
jgi:molecular chaperone DnaK